MFPRSCDTSSETRSAAPGWGTASGETCAGGGSRGQFYIMSRTGPLVLRHLCRDQLLQSRGHQPRGHVRGPHEEQQRAENIRWRSEYKMEEITEQIIYDGEVLP